ncbi:T9SS type A sorting domain-containing protein [Flavisolibacter sp. BT320]|nr:T9SS type A sorting domain-containing protein [Flavisolibacter longurius]
MKHLYASIALLFSLSSFGQAGSLVSTFGTGGRVQTSFSSLQDGATALLVQPDGKLVAGGTSLFSGNQDFSLARYNTDGTLDLTFSSDGKQTTAIGTGSDIINGMALQADGKIVAVGETLVGSTYMAAIARYNTDGTLDASFSGDGKHTVTLGTKNAYAYAVAIQPDGKILVAGYTFEPGTVDFTVFRFLSDGTLDVSFSGDGIATVDYASTLDNAYAMALQPDGKILLAGNASANFMLARLNSDGSMDSSFDGDGKLVTVFANGARLNTVALQADGKIVAAGQRSYNDPMMDRTVYDGIVTRYTSTGQLDATFNGTGQLSLDLGSDNDNIRSVKLQNDGKIMLCATGNMNFTLARLNTNGTLDNSFDGDGKVDVSFGSPSYSNALALWGDRIFIAGSINSRFGLAAYQNDAFPLPVTLSFFGGTRQISGVQLSWQTASEQNTDHFELERSADGRSFSPIGRVAATGNTTSAVKYGFLDTHPGTGSKYYRVKVVDRDGKFSYSEVINVNNPIMVKLDLYPNPFRQHATIKMGGAQQAGIFTLRVLDAGGRLVDMKRNLPAGQTIQLGSQYRPGTYMVEVVQGDRRYQTWLIKVSE